MINSLRFPGSTANSFLFLAGLFLRLINKIRHRVVGYTSPRPFRTAHAIERDVAYTLDVVNNWLGALRVYTGEDRPFKDKHVLELGPGPDLGTGLVIMALGARSYTAIDKHNLAAGARPDFYKALSVCLKTFPAFDRARKALEGLMTGRPLPWFSYRYSPGFRLDLLPQRIYQLVVSQAVLEHIDDVPALFRVLKTALAGDALMIHEVDAATHTRWIKDVDPLNLLRYPETLYSLLKFNGAPNRLRMPEYKSILQALGFKHIRTNPLVTVRTEYLKRIIPALACRFKRFAPADLAVQSFQLLAAGKDL